MPTALAGSHGAKAYGASSGVVGVEIFWAVTMARSHGSAYSVFERKHEKQVQAVKVHSVNLPSEEGIVQVMGNDSSGKLFWEEEGSEIHIVGIHAHVAQHRHNHASGAGRLSWAS
ncbi:hypothetical protein Tco_0676368 [Tanacetum coccineum]